MRPAAENPFIGEGSSALKQASYWHNKRFTPWHAIWRANEGRNRDSARGSAWGCG